MTTEPNKKNVYKETLNLPQTGFAMEAKLTQNEPARLKGWQDQGLYQQLMDARKGAEKWVLHDGPPFANGDIHIGHLINKTLKDVILRFRSLQGFQTPYVPGWDCHGLPIEHKIQEEIKKEGKNIREMSTVEVRQRCYAYAEKYAAVQSVQFQRLGILGDWANPYLTMTRDYEASTIEVFAKFVEAGLVYKQLKPVPWSVANQTALADAELEYKDVEDPSIFVEFPIEPGTELGKKFAGTPTFFLVWTTTPWTLPANLAIAAGPEVNYALVEYVREGQKRIGILAADLVERVMGDLKAVESFKVLGETLTGHELSERAEYRHPFLEYKGRILTAEYVTTTDGTGLVHTAPGHGADDYETGVKHGLPVYSPVLANGRYDETVPEFLRGKSTKEANPLIVEHLKGKGLLFALKPIVHSYPHDWRSKTPIIYRATEQWFVAMDKGYKGGASVRDRAKKVVEETKFVPEWGKARMGGMLESRPDWCISRQRAWGLPIPVFYNEKGDALLTPASVRAVAKRFAEKGSDSWYTDSPAELLGDFDPGANFPKETLRKEKDIFDVWFESGSSWHGVLQARANLKFPADMYLEGSDQHRGWFQLSLLPALGAAGQAPFKEVLTHGFVVKPDGTKVSKSDKEYVTATKEIDTHGADVLRLWCCSVDYQNDIPASPQALKEFGDKYRKIRNTLRYLMSNLYDYVPGEVEVPVASLDGWAVAELDTLIGEVVAAYEGYNLHRAFRLLHDFCAVQISAVYGNAMKDRLYCEAPDGALRRRTQYVMHKMVLALTKLLSPMLVFTADEAWQQIQHKPAEDAAVSSVHLALLPKASGAAISDQQREDWKMLMSLRDSALIQLDKLKKEAGLNKALDAEVVYHVNSDELRQRLQAFGADLEDVVGAGHHSFAEAAGQTPGVRVEVIDRRASYPACARSWKRRPDVGQDQEYPDLSLRDAQAMRAMKK
ncbi:MAG TPA: isoleucine--tRNA ligase [Tepidisphaeraceae bacterium]|jgi:isoleucyl-tRNA synthetase|nr:isoleucine--tRNA ligase [Tepidisphaeraceae bacterium]